MNTLSERSEMDIQSIHQHQPNCKHQCFIFTEVVDIDLAPEVTKFSDGSEKIKVGGILIHDIKKEQSSGGSREYKGKANSRKALIGCGFIIICLTLAAGIPLGMQLRSSSLLEARLSYIRRLMAESPLIESSWADKLKLNSTKNMVEARQNNIGAILWPMNADCRAQYLDAVQLALEEIDKVKRIVKQFPSIRIATSAYGIEGAHKHGEVAVLLGIDGGHMLGTSLAVLRSMYLVGVRFVSLTSIDCSTPWAIATTRTDDSQVVLNTSESFNDFGKTILTEMNRIGMLAEISYLNEGAMYTVVRKASRPVFLMNATPASLCNDSKIATVADKVLSLLPTNGGVIMLNLEFCGERQLGVREAITHINYVRKIAGLDHIGIGRTPKTYALLLAELARDRIWGSSAIKKLSGGNFLRILREVETLKNTSPANEEWIPHELMDSNLYCRYPES